MTSWFPTIPTSSVRVDSIGWTNGRRFGVSGSLGTAPFLDLGHRRSSAAPGPRRRASRRHRRHRGHRLCQPCSEFALAEHWYAATALKELLGVPDARTKDRLYIAPSTACGAKSPSRTISKHNSAFVPTRLRTAALRSRPALILKVSPKTTISPNARDHRSDCKQVVIALIVTREGFPLAHQTFAGNTRDLKTVKHIVTAIEGRFGKSQRVWVMDRGMIDEDSLAFLSEEAAVIYSPRAAMPPNFKAS